jgi:versiconal hemiacetal acetate esterase
MGDLDGEDAQVRRFCKDSGVVIVSVDFCLAPANPYPKPLDDCVKAFYWVLENSQVLGAKEGKVVVIGTSAGGNLALSTALKVIDQGKGESLGGVMALVPCTVAREAVPEKWKGRYTSYEEHAEHTVNTTRAMDMFFGESYGSG